MASTYHCMWEMEKMFPRGGHSAAVTSHKDRQPGRRQEGGEYGKGGERDGKEDRDVQEDNNGRSSVFQLHFIFQNLAKRSWSRSKELEVEVEVEGGKARLTVDSSQWIRGRNVSNVRW